VWITSVAGFLLLLDTTAVVSTGWQALLGRPFWIR
jgi:hypothetical protein